MKHNYFILLAIALVLGVAFSGCKKDIPETVIPKITDDKVEVTATTATFTWTVEWPGKIVSVVEVSEHEDMSEATRFGLEEELNKKTFLVTATDLKPATKYYYHFMVWNHSYVGNEFIMETKWFTTATDLPMVKTMEVTDVTTTTATMTGEVVNDCGSGVTECGFCWSTQPDPDINGSHKKCDAVSDHFALSITGLSAATRYYVRAYAINQAGTGYGEELTFYTGDVTSPEVIISNVTVNTFSVTVDCNVVSDGGGNVTKRGVCWSTSPNPEYTGSHLSSGSGTGSFSVDLTGLEPETQYHVRAYAVNSIDVAYSDDQTFTAPQVPTGAINGLFSVSETEKVLFSKGNLQYIGNANTPYWKFADNQWDYLESSTNQNSTAPNVDRDLFGWGTSGYHDGNDSYNLNYQPYSTSNATVNTNYNYYGYGPSTNQNNYNIAGTHYDWGVHNAISNGGNQAGLWRTLTMDEWKYVFNERSVSTVNGTPNARFAKGKVNNVYGVILFPDDYKHPSGVTAPFSINDTGDTGWNYNAYSESDWALMEAKGCIFLPAAGYRNGTLVNYAGSVGYYWSASYISRSNSYFVLFNDSNLYPQDNSNLSHRCNGYSVRLVRDAQ